MVSTFQRSVWFPQINLLVQVYDTLWVKWDNIKYSLCLIWSRELNFQHLHLKRVPKPWGYWIFAGGLLCGFGFFKLDIFTQILSGFQSKLKQFLTYFHSLIVHPQHPSSADPRGFMVHYSMWQGWACHKTCEPMTNAHVPVRRTSAGAGYWPQDIDPSEISLHAC